MQSKILLNELGVTKEVLSSRPSSSESEKCALEELRKAVGKDTETLKGELKDLRKILKVSKEVQNDFREEEKLTEGLQAKLDKYRKERDRLWDEESSTLMAELSITRRKSRPSTRRPCQRLE